MFEGQSFPFRLWHLINNDFFNDVIRWSTDGNSIVIPSECDFVEKVLRRTDQRIFKTESMKSFVRQLNLYGFHKVQLEKDETFAYLRLKSKQRWPDAVFSQASFKKGRPDLLENVKRRCKVKASDLQNKLNKDIAQEMLNHQYQMAPAFAFENNNRRENLLMQYPQLFPQNPQQVENHFPNVLPQSDQSVDPRGTKRKLQFAEEKVMNSKKPIPPQAIPIHPQAMQFPSSPFYFYPPTFINGNFPHMMPPPGWSMAPGNPLINQPMFTPGSENINLIPQQISFIKKPIPVVSTTQPTETEKTLTENTSASSTEDSSDDSQNEEPKTQMMSPLAKFCAQLFRPESLNNTPSKNCQVDVEDTNSDFVA